MSKIKTSGDLREFLASALNGVSNGTFDVDKAKNVVKIAQQINESFYAEIKIAKIQTELGAERAKFGALPLADETK